MDAIFAGKDATSIVGRAAIFHCRFGSKNKYLHDRKEWLQCFSVGGSFEKRISDEQERLWYIGTD